MRILFASSNPPDISTIEFDREILALERTLAGASSPPVDFTALPGLTLDALHEELGRRKPDILHLTVHGEEEELFFMDENRAPVGVGAETLETWFNSRNPPKLVYLNACNSSEIAKGLAERGHIAIGHNAPITNDAARSGAVVFYREIMMGHSLDRAFNASQEMILKLTKRKTTSELFDAGKNLASITLHALPQIVAKFEDPYLRYPDISKIQLGIAFSPKSTIRVVFFAADNVGSQRKPRRPHVLQCTTARLQMMEPSDGWEISRNTRIFAAGADRMHPFILTALLSEALSYYYQLQPNESTNNAQDAITQLQKDKLGDE